MNRMGYLMGSKPSHVTEFWKCGWAVAGVLAMCLQLVGCSMAKSHDLNNSTGKKSVVMGFVRVEPTGPFFRKHQSEPLVRFFDVRNTTTGERTRVHVTEKPERFVTGLSPGQYEVFRIQIGEGPFRSEAHVDMSFDVLPDKANYLGIWRLQIDSPQTVRMLHWRVIEEVLDRKMLVALYPELAEQDLVVSLPQPESTEIRLFAVAPLQPRSKYFYRR